jgi:hypothetical protein
MNPAHHLGQPASHCTAAARSGLELLRYPVSQESLARSILDGLHSFLSITTQLQHLNIICLEEILQLCLGLFVEILWSLDIDLVVNYR